MVQSIFDRFQEFENMRAAAAERDAESLKWTRQQARSIREIERRQAELGAFA